MKTNISKAVFKRSLALAMGLLIALSGMWTGLATVSFAEDSENPSVIVDEENTFSGTVGKLTWTLDKRTSILEISGNGDMISFANANSPWYDYRSYIKEIIISDGVTSIGASAFKDCSNLETVTIGSGVTRIEDNAFAECRSLKKVYAKDIESWLKISYGDSYGTNPLYYGADLYLNDRLAIDIVVPESITEIKYCAFYNCDTIKNILIPDSVKTIGAYAFYGCDNLEDVTTGNGVESIGYAAFGSCKSLKNVTIGNNVSSIANSTFASCESLEKITIPYSVKNIKSSAFNGCSKLKEIVVYSTDCDFNENCGFNYNQTIYGFVGSTSEAFADKIGAEFIDVEAIHTHEYVKTELRGYCSYEKCDCGKVNRVAHADSDYNGVCDNCSKSSNDIDVGETIKVSVIAFETSKLRFATAEKGEYTVKIKGDYSYCYISVTDTKISDTFGESDSGETTVTLESGKLYYLNLYTGLKGEDLEVTISFKSHSHFYTSKMTKKPTCSNTGIETFTCSCGDTYTETIAKTGHNLGDWYVSKHGNCSTATVLNKKCANCSYKEEKTLPATGKHTSETTIARATDTHDGSVITSCSVCGAIISKSTVYKIASVKLSGTKYTCDGKAKTPSVTVKDSKGKSLKKDTDYTVTYASGRKNVGKYAVTVKFKGNYGGTEKLSFTIVPATPSGVSYIASSTSSVKLSWNAVKGAMGYIIYRYNTSTKKYSKIAIVDDLTSYTVSSLKAGTSYKFRIKAYTETSDDSIYVSSATSVFTACTKPATPTLKVTSSSKGKATLTWTNVSGESGYQIYYSTKKDSGFKLYGTAKADTTKATVSKLTSGKTYYFRVRAFVKTDSGTVYSGYKTVSVKVK